ncbi:hypothetical protein PFISCL1PPCAC_28327, partial [Pristionchus fissidentatus]
VRKMTTNAPLLIDFGDDDGSYGAAPSASETHADDRESFQERPYDSDAGDEDEQEQFEDDREFTEEQNEAAQQFGQFDDGEDETEGASEEEEGEEVDVNNLYDDPQNLRVEYIGKYRMVVVDLEVDDSFLVPSDDEPDAIPRMVVIDAANVLHGWTPVSVEDSARSWETDKVDAAYILSLVRIFVSKGIECVVVTHHKYMKKEVTENYFILESLHRLGMILLMDNTYDDLVFFAVAGEFDAVILTEDQFKKERERGMLDTPD